MDVAAIASALAARFNSSNLTAPSGYSAVALATHQLPNAITTTPTVLVFPPEISSEYPTGHKRSSNLIFPVRFYVAMTSDRPRAVAALYAWQSVLLDQLEAKYDLGLSASSVTHAVVLSSTGGTGEYGDQEYAIVELEVGVHVEEGFSPTTS